MSVWPSPVWRLQEPVLHQGDRRGPQVPRQPRAGPHPEQDRLLPDEYPRAAAHHLPVSPWRERAQPARPAGRGLGPVLTGEKGT